MMLRVFNDLRCHFLTYYFPRRGLLFITFLLRVFESLYIPDTVTGI